MVLTVDTDTEFTIVFLPDTQHYSRLDNGIFETQTQWISNNLSTYNIQMVLHAGDLVHNPGTSAEWDVAEGAMDTLDDNDIPALIALGNHDASDIRSPSTFRSRFPTSRYTSVQSADASITDSGTYDDNPENAYLVQEAFGESYLHITLEFGPRQEVLDWADGVISSKGITTVLLTHTHLYIDGTKVESGDSDAPGTYSLGSDFHNGTEVWDELINGRDEIGIVLSAHHIGTPPFAAHKIEYTQSRSLVSQQFANYQTDSNGGDGWLRLLTVAPDDSEVRVDTYSPQLDQWGSSVNEAFSVPLRAGNLKAKMSVGFDGSRWS